MKKRRPPAAALLSTMRDDEDSQRTQREIVKRPRARDIPLIEPTNVRDGSGEADEKDSFEGTTSPGTGVNWRAATMMALAHLKTANAQLLEVDSPRVQVAAADVALAIRVLSAALEGRDEPDED